MKTPAFWQSRNALSDVLLPFSFLYEIGSTLYQAVAQPATLPIPIICIGNLTAGGAGKTPVALYVGQWLKEHDVTAFFLSRGYSGTISEPTLVNPTIHTAQEVGDEPLLLAELLPTIVARDRLSGAHYAMAQGAKIIVMDDGFQNTSFTKTLSLLVIDGQHGFGNKRLLPAGPLRETPEMGFKRAHAAIVINRSETMPALPPDLPLLTATIQPKQDVLPLRGKKILPFCGIAYPQKFFDMLKVAGAELADSIAFPDHYPYSLTHLSALAAKAAAHQALLVTTAKDYVRLPASFKNSVTVIEVALHFDQPAMLDALLNVALNAHEKPHASH